MTRAFVGDDCDGSELEVVGEIVEAREENGWSGFGGTQMSAAEKSH